MPGEGATPVVKLVGVPTEVQDYAVVRFQEMMLAEGNAARDAGVMAVGFIFGLIAARLAAEYE